MNFLDFLPFLARFLRSASGTRGFLVLFLNSPCLFNLHLSFSLLFIVIAVPIAWNIHTRLALYYKLGLKLSTRGINRCSIVWSSESKSNLDWNMGTDLGGWYIFIWCSNLILCWFPSIPFCELPSRIVKTRLYAIFCNLNLRLTKSSLIHLFDITPRHIIEILINIFLYYCKGMEFVLSHTYRKFSTEFR